MFTPMQNVLKDFVFATINLTGATNKEKRWSPLTVMKLKKIFIYLLILKHC